MQSVLPQRLVLGLLGCLAACASAPPQSLVPLPFHVAVVPVQAPFVRQPAEPAYEDETEMRLAPDTSALTEAVARALDRARFARVTLLAAPAGGGSPPADAAGWDRQIVDQARAANADLLLQCELSYDPVIWRRTNPNFWMNWMLFLMGGPFVYFLEDHTYFVDCELEGSLYDLHALDSVEPRLGDRLSRVYGTTVSFPGVPLDFIDRADGVGDYALSLICPAGYLAKESDELSTDVHAVVVDSLARQIADSLRSRSDSLFRPDGIVPFWVDPDEVRVELNGGGELLVEGSVHLDLGSGVEVMREYRIGVGDEVVTGEFDEGQPDEQPRAGRAGSLRYAFREVLAVRAVPATVRLELQAGERQVFVRSYTFPVGRAAELAKGAP